MSALLAVGVFTAGCVTGPAAPTQSEPIPIVSRLEPEGFVPLNDQPWAGLTTHGWGYLRRTAAKDAEIVADSSAPFSPPQVLRMVFTPGMRRDSEPSVHWVQLGGPREVYARWWMKLSENWQASPAGGGKIAFLWPQEGIGVIYSNLAESGPPHYVNLATTWEPAYRFWEPNLTTTRLRYDRWYLVEWYVKWSSSPTANDGVMRWAIDGVVNGDYTTVDFPPVTPGFAQFEFAPTLQLPPLNEQYMYIDHVAISSPASAR